jgi:hypothetical protein
MPIDSVVYAWTLPAAPQGHFRKTRLVWPRESKLEISMATTSHIPVDVYLRSSYEPDAEYVDGAERPAGEYDHASWQGAICLWFGQHARDWSVRVRPSLRVQVAATRFRVPDVTVLDRDQPIKQLD